MNATLKQAGKLIQSFGEQDPSTEQLQAILGSGIITMLCRANFDVMRRSDRIKVAHALGLCPDRTLYAPSGPELIKWAEEKVDMEHAGIPAHRYRSAGQQEIQVALFPFPRRQRSSETSVADTSEDMEEACSVLEELGYHPARFTQLIAFAAEFTREEARAHWPLLPKPNAGGFNVFSPLLREFPRGGIYHFKGTDMLYPVIDYNVCGRDEKTHCIYGVEAYNVASEPGRFKEAFILGVKIQK